MRLALFSTRLLSNSALWSRGKFPKQIRGTAEEAFNLGTIHGARAVGMGDQIGSLAEGKLADIVVFSAATPTMVCAAEHDPVVAVVRHASERDVEMVIVGGVMRKQGGRLLAVRAEKGSVVEEGEQLKWEDVARELVRSRKEVQERAEGTSREAAEGLLKSMLQYNEEDFVDVED